MDRLPLKPFVRTQSIRNRYLLLIDASLLAAAALLAYAARFETLRPLRDIADPIYWYVALTVPLRILMFVAGGLYRRLWRHASISELERIFTVGLVAAIVSGAFGLWGMSMLGIMAGRIPLSVVVLDMVMTVAVPASTRLLIRIGVWRRLRDRRADVEHAPVIIAGAGSTGQMIAKELLGNPRLRMVPVGFIDDDLAKQRNVIAGVPVLGRLRDLSAQAEDVKATRLIIAIPNASGPVVRELVKAAREAGLETRTVPGLAELLSGRANVIQLREVEIQDLLRREPVQTDLKLVSELATGRVVMVTGAGGSIGSELCRQLAHLAPLHLVLLGHGENSIFDAFHELRDAFPGVRLSPVIADVRDRARIGSVIREYAPHAIFHAAAHKHVPLMEENPQEAVTNNVAGTRNVVDAAVAAGTAHLVLISTDKAVRPTSVMGATKRVAEMVVQRAAARHGRNFVSVRFGNVLGSRGSVVPIFLRQIRAGGPVKVTHPEMRRYFMTIPEAVQLVLQAGAIGKGKEVFVLDMGEPVKVVDIATDLIRLSGLDVGADIQIVFSGIRPGEKLYEEMFFSNENASPTDHPKVLRAKLPPLEASDEQVDALIAAAERGAAEAELRGLLTDLVPDFHPVDYERITPAEALAAIVPPPIAAKAFAGGAPANGQVPADMTQRQPSRPGEAVALS